MDSQQLKIENEKVLLPFVEWLQRVEFGNNPSDRYLKRLKMNLSSIKRVYCVLTDRGKAKSSEPLVYWAKIQRIWDDSVGVEIVNAVEKKRILFQTKASQFNFEKFEISSKEFQNHVDNYLMVPYNHEFIIGSGAGYRSDPANENSPIIDTYSYDEEFAPRPSSASLSSLSSSTSTSVPQTSNLNPTNSNKPSSLDVKKEAGLIANIESLKNTNARLTARFFISQISSDSLAQQLIAQQSRKNSFNPNEYEPKRLVTKTPNGNIYGVNHKVNTDTLLSIKEVIEIKQDEDRLKIACLSNELGILKQLKTSEAKCRNLLYLKEHHVEQTPFRTSHYLLMEPSVMNLQDAYNKLIKPKDQKVASIITAQVLSALSFLKDNFQTIHGNLTFQTILFDLQGIIKLSGFEFSYSANNPIDANLLLSGNYEQDALFKHPKILENASKAEKIIVKSNIDLWSMGCINYKLMTGDDLFITSRSWTEYGQIVAKKQRLNDPIELALSLLVDFQENAEPSTYLFSNNLQQSVEDNILSYCATIEKQA